MPLKQKVLLSPRRVKEPERNRSKTNINQMMKVRITPLNFASAFFICFASYCWIFGVKISGVEFKHMNAALGWIFLLFALVVAFMDLMFRNFFPQIKKLWIVEL